MIFRQLIRENGGCVTYIFGCSQARELFVVDPILEGVGGIIDLSKRLNMKVEYIIETHTHADHLSGARKLASITGSKVVYGEGHSIMYPVETIKDGEEIKLGNTRVKALATPGHTPDSISLLITDLKRGNEPWAVITGDTLFVGSVGRVDIGKEDSWEDLFKSLQKLRTLPDYLEILPAHTSGSACGIDISGKPFSTIGFEKKFNKYLRVEKKEEFAKLFINQSKPEEFEKI
ncbi:MBL fold metallo-hydrolase [Acidianus sp. RZ1]|uniref:MBL fold metallo-hydrolase n=1 Tax=Acidianus sp. RZ1 TaxID=1540082 RepID=UPI001492B2E0|nr:MBL fold metallo-hydrolase [Acidianus sp. RZ1]NON62282.1 MBL fold metallo-hydrolase [Acidianus sp. RZ1]